MLQLVVSDATLSSSPASVTNTFNATGPTTSKLTPETAQMDTRASLTMTVTLDQPALPGGQLVDLAASNSNVTVPANVTVPQGSTTANFQAVRLDVGNVTVTASATGLTGDSSTNKTSTRVRIDQPAGRYRPNGVCVHYASVASAFRRSSLRSVRCRSGPRDHRSDHADDSGGADHC